MHIGDFVRDSENGIWLKRLVLVQTICIDQQISHAGVTADSCRDGLQGILLSRHRCLILGPGWWTQRLVVLINVRTDDRFPARMAASSMTLASDQNGT